MKSDIERAVSEMISAIETAAREHAAYDRDPHDRKADRDDYRARIDARRDDAIARARATLTRVGEQVHALYERLRRSSYDEAGVEAAWKRVKTLLESGRGIDDVVARDGFDRNEAEAIRRNYAVWMAARLPEARPVDIERRVMPDLYRMQKAEIALMDRAEADATRAEHERIATESAVQAVDKLAVAAATTGNVPAQSMLEVGFAQIEAGIAPPAKEWAQILAEVDPESAASSRRNALAPDHRDKLDENARSVGFDRPPAEPSLDLGR